MIENLKIIIYKYTANIEIAKIFSLKRILNKDYFLITFDSVLICNKISKGGLCWLGFTFDFFIRIKAVPKLIGN